MERPSRSRCGGAFRSRARPARLSGCQHRSDSAAGASGRSLTVGLVWPSHDAHQTAQRWFAKNSRDSWATCAITEAAFVRIVSNPAFSPDAVAPREAFRLLESNLAHPHHRYWEEEGGFLGIVRDLIGQIQGHRQITDAYLLGLALRRKGRLATLDRSIAILLPHGVRQSAVEVVELPRNRVD